MNIQIKELENKKGHYLVKENGNALSDIVANPSSHHKQKDKTND